MGVTSEGLTSQNISRRTNDSGFPPDRELRKMKSAGELRTSLERDPSKITPFSFVISSQGLAQTTNLFPPSTATWVVYLCSPNFVFLFHFSSPYTLVDWRII